MPLIVETEAVVFGFSIELRFKRCGQLNVLQQPARWMCGVAPLRTGIAIVAERAY